MMDYYNYIQLIILWSPGRRGSESTREIVYIYVVRINSLGTVFAVIAMVVFQSLINLYVLNLSSAK